MNEENPILTRDEAIAFLKLTSARQFKSYRAKYKLKSVGRNRFSRRDLMVALNREAGNLPLPRTLKKGGKYA